MVVKEAALRLKPADKKVIEAFTKKQTLDSQLLSSDGRSLRKHGLGGEKVAVWRGPQITIVSTVSAKSDETIIRYLTKVVGKGLVTWEGLKFQTGGDMLYAGQWDGWVTVHVPGVSQPVGRLDWREYDGEYSVKMIEVDPDYQRSGIATALYKKLFKDQGITKRDLGPSMQTPSGGAFRRTLGRVGSSLVPTGQEVGLGGQLYYMPLSQDTFVHFTPMKRASEVLAAGKLLMRPPYKKMGIDAVAAVSTVWGWSTPNVQTSHIKPGEGPIAAIVFKTTAKPDSGNVEEVLWHRDVPLVGAHVVPGGKGAGLLRNTPERLPDDQDGVTYDRSAVTTARRVATRWLQTAYPMTPLPAVEIRQTATHGKGLFAAQPIPKGQTIRRMAGDIVPEDARPNFQVGASTWMGPMGPTLDALNHSCDPNCAVMVEQPGRPVVTIRDIGVGEEIMADYSVTSTSPSDGRFVCHCGAGNCRGRGAGGFHSIPAGQRQHYRALGVVPSYVG